MKWNKQDHVFDIINPYTVTYRQATTCDTEQLKDLAVRSWQPFKKELTADNWQKLFATLSNPQTFTHLLRNSHCVVCETNSKIIGMAFLVPSGNATEIYEAGWCTIRFVSVDPDFGGQGIGRQLTAACIETARQNGERTIALHTSEMMHTARRIYESFGFKI